MVNFMLYKLYLNLKKKRTIMPKEESRAGKAMGTLVKTGEGGSLLMEQGALLSTTDKV